MRQGRKAKIIRDVAEVEAPLGVNVAVWPILELHTVFLRVLNFSLR
jgi:hypothetical protein